MNPARSPAKLEFDAYAGSYDAALAEGLSASGEDKNYFAEGRARWLRGCLNQLGVKIETVLDFGCGTGSATPFLLQHLGAPLLTGVDVSAQSIAEAQKQFSSGRALFRVMEDCQPDGQTDLVFCNGVFHHIPRAERLVAMRYVVDSLKPGGFFALWENNPWNPGTRYVMRRIPFDRDAITLTPPEARQLVRQTGFEILRTDFLFVFPRMLGWLRWMEPRLASYPLGGQYQILCRKAS